MLHVVRDGHYVGLQTDSLETFLLKNAQGFAAIESMWELCEWLDKHHPERDKPTIAKCKGLGLRECQMIVESTPNGLEHLRERFSTNCQPEPPRYPDRSCLAEAFRKEAVKTACGVEFVSGW